MLPISQTRNSFQPLTSKVRKRAPDFLQGLSLAEKQWLIFPEISFIKTFLKDQYSHFRWSWLAEVVNIELSPHPSTADLERVKATGLKYCEWDMWPVSVWARRGLNMPTFNLGVDTSRLHKSTYSTDYFCWSGGNLITMDFRATDSGLRHRFTGRWVCVQRKSYHKGSCGFCMCEATSRIPASKPGVDPEGWNKPP